MTKSELIKLIAKRNPNLPINNVTKVVDVIFEQLCAALERGERIELRGFGTFSTRQRTAREARNPRTNQSIEIGNRNVLYFRMGKEFREEINSNS